MFDISFVETEDGTTTTLKDLILCCENEETGEIMCEQAEPLFPTWRYFAIPVESIVKISLNDKVEQNVRIHLGELFEIFDLVTTGALAGSKSKAILTPQELVRFYGLLQDICNLDEIITERLTSNSNK